jgi:hypothetical protein
VVSQPSHGLQRSPKVRPGRCWRTRGHDAVRLPVRVRRGGTGILLVPSAVEGSKSAAADAPKGLALSRLFSSSDVTGHATLAPGHSNSTRYTVKVEFAVNPSRSAT